MTDSLVTRLYLIDQIKTCRAENCQMAIKDDFYTFVHFLSLFLHI